MKRIQRKRTAGWRMPSSTVYVGRPTPWGNPYCVVTVMQRGVALWEIHQHTSLYVGASHYLTPPSQRATFRAFPVRFVRRGDALLTVINLYRAWLKIQLSLNPNFLDPLRGRDLACWCNEGHPCHADVLLEFLAEGVGHESET